MTYIKGSPEHWTEDMTDTVTIYAATTLDNYGKRSVSANGKTYPCRIIADIVKTTTDQTRNTLEEGRLIILGDPTITIGDVLNTGSGQKGIITRIDKKNYSANGVTTPHHAVIFFGRA
jgi:hypothetical protein